MAPDFELSHEDSPTAEQLARLREGLTEHALEFIDRPGFRTLAFFAHDPGGRTVGGVYGFVNWCWLDVSLLWVAEDLRGAGLGSRLLTTFEAEGRGRGCTGAHLETFSYQARKFYERHGYRIFAELEDYPPGHTKFFLRKALGRD